MAEPRTWQQAERRALVADLVRTQRTLQARSEQLQEIFGSRWYRVARFFWRLRRGSVLRKLGPPRMADEGSFARPLSGEPLDGEAPEVRLVPTPNGDGAAVDLERQRWLAGAQAPSLRELRVAAILDAGTEACLAPECELDTGFGTSDWRDRLEAHPPHLLLVEAAWAGNGGAWTNGIARRPGSPRAELPALRELVDWCREHGIPTAFWATQDPLGFDRFAEAAALFDHVFTVDADRIPAYHQLPGVAAGTVSTLLPAAQPRLHNPMARTVERQPGPAFVGCSKHGWPRQRLDELTILLDAAEPFGLTIYESGHGYAETVAACKRHPLFLSASPTATSPTAVPRQVFEQLACGAAVVSTPSTAIGEILGELVPVAGNRKEAGEQLERLLGDEAHRRELTARGRRHVLAMHTYRDRLAELVAALGFEVAPDAEGETAVLLPADDPSELGEAVDSLLEQSLAPSELLLGLAGEAAVQRDLDRLRERFPGARVRTMSQDRRASTSDRIRELARLSSTPWVAPLAPTLRYGPHHLRDLVACARFAEADVIGFGDAANGGPHRYAEAVRPHAALAARDLVAARGWPRDEATLREWFSAGVRIYAGETGEGVAEAAR